VIVKPEHQYNFCYVLPQASGGPVIIVVPSALQMGWQESPAYFCAATETGRDVIQWLMEKEIPMPRHPCKKYMMPDHRPKRSSHQLAKPWKLSVYADDYILAVLSSAGIRFIERIARSTLYGIHTIFPPPAISGHSGGKNPISDTKLERGDARLMTEKDILGFDGDGKARTWKLPKAKLGPICQELKKLGKQVRVQRPRLEKLTGKLVNVTRIAPAAKALLTPFFKALHTNPSAHKITKQPFDLFSAMQDLEARLTHVSELVKFTPSAAGLDDAAKPGMGGVWIGPGFQPTVWRVEFPPDVQALFAEGALTINNLEMAAIVVQMMVLEALMPLRRTHVKIFSDNALAAVWARKLIVHSNSVTAARLVMVLAMRQRTNESAMPLVEHWPGSMNVLADDTTRSFKTFNSGPLQS
jgi:hypothetical protein